MSRWRRTDDSDSVAAFLVNMTLTRLVALEREQIGLMKALGLSAGEQSPASNGRLSRENEGRRWDGGLLMLAGRPI